MFKIPSSGTWVNPQHVTHITAPHAGWFYIHLVSGKNIGVSDVDYEYVLQFFPIMEEK